MGGRGEYILGKGGVVGSVSFCIFLYTHSSSKFFFFLIGLII